MYQPREGVDAKTRDGQCVTGIKLEKDPCPKAYPWSGLVFVSCRHNFTNEGKFWSSPTASNLDLVSDWEEQPKEEPMKYET